MSCEDLSPIAEKTAVKEELDALIAGFLFGAFEGIRKLRNQHTAAFRLRPRDCRLCPAIPYGPACLALWRDVRMSLSCPIYAKFCTLFSN